MAMLQVMDIARHGFGDVNKINDCGMAAHVANNSSVYPTRRISIQLERGKGAKEKQWMLCDPITIPMIPLRKGPVPPEPRPDPDFWTHILSR